MVPGRVGVVVAVRRCVRMRMVLHLVRPGWRGRALVVLGRHVAARTRAAGRVGSTPAAASHAAAEVSRRRAPRDRASAT